MNEKQPLNFFKLNLELVSISLIIILWISMIILVNPIGNFPLNDDWAYGWSVKTLLETGDFQLSDWTAVNLLPQIILGTIICVPLGFSFTTLRFLSLFLGLLGVLTTYGLLREVQCSPRISLLGALLIALNPIYFQLSNSFNTDIPSFTLVVLSLYFFIRGLGINSKLLIFVGLLLSYLAILNRQSSLLVLPALGLAYLIKNGLNKKTIIEAICPIGLGISLYLLYSSWLRISERKPLLYNFQTQKLLESFSTDFSSVVLTYANNLLIIFIYLGLFLFPFLIVQFSTQFKDFRVWQRRTSLLLLFLTIAIGLRLIAKGLQIPLLIGGYILEPLGLGPQTLDGYNSFLDWNSGALVNRTWKALTLIGMIGAALLFQCHCIEISQIFKQRQNLKLASTYSIPLTICTCTSFLYLLPIAGLDKNFWFDRYLILLLPLLMVVAALPSIRNKRESPKVWIFSLGLVIVIYGGFSVSATHDYLSWNRLRWQILDGLVMHEKIAPSNINGGFEFNGWNFGNRIETCNPSFQENSYQTHSNWDSFTCIQAKESVFKISFIPQEKYQIQAQYFFERWLPLREEKLYVLKNLK